MYSIQYRLEVIAPFVHLGIDLCGSVRVCLPMID